MLSKIDPKLLTWFWDPDSSLFHWKKYSLIYSQKSCRYNTQQQYVTIHFTYKKYIGRAAAKLPVTTTVIIGCRWIVSQFRTPVFRKDFWCFYLNTPVTSTVCVCLCEKEKEYLWFKGFVNESVRHISRLLIRVWSWDVIYVSAQVRLCWWH